MLPIFPIEDAIISLVQANSNAFFDLFFKAITYLGHPAFWLFIAAVLYWNNKERESFFLVNTIVFAAALSGALKIFFARPRPSGLLHQVFPQDKISAILESNAPQFGFPSGHATTIASVLTFFSKNKSKAILALFAIAALLVALSRIYLGVHFPLDIIAGLLLGLIVGAGVLWIDKVFEKHKFHLTKLEDELIVIVLIAIGIIAIALLDVPVLAVSVLGYYTGFFFSKEVGFKQSEFKGRKKILKLAAGTISAAIMLVLTIALYSVNPLLALACFFGNGFWLTFGFPEFFDKIMKETRRFPAVEKLLK